MNESLYTRLFKLAAENNLEIQLCFVPTTTGPRVVWRVYEIPELVDDLSDCLANRYSIPLYDNSQLPYLSDDQIVERFEELIEQIRKARIKKNEMPGIETEAGYRTDFSIKHCKSCMFARGCLNKKVEKYKPCHRYRPKSKGGKVK